MVFFLVRAAFLFTLRTFSAQINWRVLSRKVLFDCIAFCQTNRLFILLEKAQKEIRFSMANGRFKRKMDIDCHGPRLMLNNCKNLNPSYFSLPSTFKDKKNFLGYISMRFRLIFMYSNCPVAFIGMRNPRHIAKHLMGMDLFLREEFCYVRVFWFQVLSLELPFRMKT